MPETDARSADDRSYDEIWALLSQTARGRCFLAECGRRSRGADTQIVLDAVARLETRLRVPPSPGDTDRTRHAVSELADLMRRVTADVAAVVTPSIAAPPALDDEPLEHLVRSTERATSAMMAASEQVQETAWTMRESGFDPALCDRLDASATDIYAACAMQDVSAKAVARIVRHLGAMESRIDALARSWTGRAALVPLPGGPGRDPEALPPSDVDFVVVAHAITDDDPRAESPTGAAPGDTVASDDARRAALMELARLDTLPTRERLALFT